MPEPPPSADPRAWTRKRPFLVAISSHWLSLLGIGLIATGLITWLLVLPLQIRGHVENPYVGIILFVIVPMIFLAGLAIVPVGVWLGRRRLKAHIPSAVFDNRTALMRLGTFLGVATALNLVVGTQLSYRAVEHMESPQFCGQTCHVMRPEFAAYQNSAHSRVVCVDCHVAPGAGGWFASKMAGSRQLLGVTLNNYQRPIHSAIESGRLVPSRQTCEQCHWPQKFAGTRIRVIPKYADDEKNTESFTVLSLIVGGQRLTGIHGTHFGPGVKIRFAAADARRQTIPRVIYANDVTGVTQDFRAAESKPAEVEKLALVDMSCIDCHNRPTHAFDLPDRAVNNAMVVGDIPQNLPWVKKKAVELLKVTYASNEEAEKAIPAALRGYYEKEMPAVAKEQAADVERAGKGIVAIFNRNVFPDLKVTWGTYPNNAGHEDFPGCFRCHDDGHKTADGKMTITQDCSACHEVLAQDEAKPAIVKTLGLEAAMTALKTGK